MHENWQKLKESQSRNIVKGDEGKLSGRNDDDVNYLFFRKIRLETSLKCSCFGALCFLYFILHFLISPFATLCGWLAAAVDLSYQIPFEQTLNMRFFPNAEHVECLSSMKERKKNAKASCYCCFDFFLLENVFCVCFALFVKMLCNRLT